MWKSRQKQVIKRVGVDLPLITELTLPARGYALAPATDMDRKAAATDGTDRRTDTRPLRRPCAEHYTERKCADTTGTVLVALAGHFQC